MEIALITKNALKIKGKHASLAVDPGIDLRTKTVVDAVLLSDKLLENNFSKIEGHRVIISGPGSYEAGKIKISGLGSGANVVYSVRVDGVEILLSKASGIKKIQGTERDYDIVVLNVDTLIEESLITSLSPKAVVLYGEKSEEMLKSLGKNPSEKVNKYQTTLEKLPKEMEIILLGQ
ncbi:MAG: hypothetical protein M1524_02350 [Patescibacteria group bacterium]|nr:hypothetical protein [Patescibacteria group bacterium]